MLSHIHLKDFAIVESLDLELSAGMTALTGETGAGKSILVDAIGLVLGDRADSGVVRYGANNAVITLSVDITDIPVARQWLISHGLEEDEDLCILRRVISSAGKSRVWINGTPCNLSMLRELGEQLVDIHGQHEHQSLMKKEIQQKLLDDFADNHKLLEKVHKKYKAWKLLHTKLEAIRNQNSDHQAKLDLLCFQTQELNELNLVKDEVSQLDEECSRLSNAEQLLETSSQSSQQLYDGDDSSVYSSISDILVGLEESSRLDSALKEPLEMLQSAQIQIQEATHLLRQYKESVELDPERLSWVNNRLSSMYDLSRKHQTSPHKLFEKWQSLHAELNILKSDDYDIDSLQEKLSLAESAYIKVANQLNRARCKAGKQLAKSVTGAMQKLGMDGGRFAIDIKEGNHFSPQGSDSIEFQVSANPGQPLKSLIKVASGGELSRISLAIQMIAAKRMTLPALIFDEVDSGIGGGIAEIVGQQLRKLGESRQVLCVTHLPQVASQAHNHYKVTKAKTQKHTTTGMLVLSEDQRIEEIARMMGGIEITGSSLTLAKEMLEAA